MAHICLRKFLKKFYENLKVTVCNKIRDMRFQWASFKLVVLFKRNLRLSLGSKDIGIRNSKRI